MDVARNIIIKGKRTKRPRPSSSPINFPLLTTSTSSSGENDSNPSPETDEEEDMANCLILLARSGADTENLAAKAVVVDGFYGGGGGGGYECKTCNKTFHSFQALGGHRASHKRPKTDSAERSLLTHQFKFHDDREEMSMDMITVSEHRLIKRSVSKVHECSICGTEFSSGQALGGHMRRHRSVTTTATTSSTARITSLDIEKTIDGKRETDEGRRRFLLLDLNLPAPDEDQVFTTLNQSSMVFAAPSLVDCHY